jgi:hypothetical protein
MAERDPTERVVVNYHDRTWSSDDAVVRELVGAIERAVSGVAVISQRQYEAEADAATERMAVRVLEIPVEEIEPALRDFDRRYGDRTYRVRNAALSRDCERRRAELARAADTDERIRLLTQAAVDYGVADRVSAPPADDLQARLDQAADTEERARRLKEAATAYEDAERMRSTPPEPPPAAELDQAANTDERRRLLKEALIEVANRIRSVPTEHSRAELERSADTVERIRLDAAADNEERDRRLKEAAAYGDADWLSSPPPENPRTRALRMGELHASLYSRLYEDAVARDPAVEGRAPLVPTPRESSDAIIASPEVAEVVSLVAPAATGVLVDRLADAAVGWFRRRRRVTDEPRVVRIYGPSGRLLRAVKVPEQADADR